VSDDMQTLQEILASIDTSRDVTLFPQLARMSEDNLRYSGLDEETHLLVRFAALAATGAVPITWVTHFDFSDPATLPLEKLIGTLVAISPIVGSAKVMDAVTAAFNAVRVTEGIAEAEG
jgi:4-carboxymuconolactone decarboxylase